MILDTLDNGPRYAGLHAGFEAAFRFLSTADLRRLPPGRHAIDGDRVFALLSEGPGRKRSEGMLETHARYIDIQHVVDGTDEMGWKPASACVRPAVPYDPEKDIAFFGDAPDAWVAVRPGAFAVFFPEDAHLPLVSDGIVRKVVVKVSVQL
jgi:YhcH/YjgK/YiaL family protein